MQVPFFYSNQYDGSQQDLELDEDTSRHIVQVLRMKEGEAVNITDGKGNLFHCNIREIHKKHCVVTITGTATGAAPVSRKITIAISLLKNTNRFEWFLEKATELGVSEIIPLLCTRTEKEKFRHDRLNAICISAMLQSQQYLLPRLYEPTAFSKIREWRLRKGTNLIAHCLPGEKRPLATWRRDDAVIPSNEPLLICIGPEGDFTLAEIESALQEGFSAVGLGNTRLRTETAGVVAATLLVNG